MEQEKPIVGDDEAVYRLPRYVPRPKPSVIPTANIFDEPTRCLQVNVEWAPHFRGVIEALDQLDTWLGTDEEIEAARQQIREVMLRFAGECMPTDPCCPELIELTQQTLLQQYFAAHQVWEQNNADQRVFNSYVYNDNYLNLWRDGGANFNSSGDGHLCNAIDIYIDNMMRGYAMQAAATAAISDALIGAALAVCVALAPGTLGASIGIGLAVTAALTLGAAAWTSILNDPECQRKVKCCMIDALKDAPVDEATFAQSAENCDPALEGNAELLRKQVSWTNQQPGNFEAFLVALSQANPGSAEDCECDCVIEDVVLVSDHPNTTLTKLTDTTWHFESSYRPGDDPTYPEAVVGQVREQFYRCLNFSFSEAQSASTTTRCNGVEEYTTGGGGGDAIRVVWRKNDGVDIDTIITILCVEP